MDHKQSVQHQFGNSAEAYVESALHKEGDDLRILVKMAQMTGQELVLDVATGGGHTANALAPHAQKVIAFDLTPQMLKVAEHFITSNGFQNVQFVEGDAENMPFSDASFDIVTCRIAPHHFPHVKTFICEVQRVLKPGGFFLLDDNVSPEHEAWDLFYNTVEKWRDPSHHRALKKTEWIHAIENQGFDILEMVNFNKTFQFDTWFERMKQPQAAKARLSRFILNAAETTRKKFRVIIEEQQVISFRGEACIIKAKKWV